MAVLPSSLLAAASAYAPCPQPGVILTAAIFFGIILVALWQRYDDRRLPPGPPRLPIIGNLHQLASGSAKFAQFQEWHQTYGDIISLRLGWTTMIVIGGNGPLVRDLLDKRGAIYSSRPPRSVANIMDEGETPISERDYQKWRTNRTLVVKSFSSSRIIEHTPSIEAESTQLLLDLLRGSAASSQHHIGRYATSVVSMLTYGFRTPTHDHPAVTGINEIMTQEDECNAGAPPMDAYPILRDKARAVGSLRRTLYKSLAGQAHSKYNHVESFASDIYAAKTSLGLTDRRIYMLLALPLEGGSDPVTSIISTALMVLVNRPDIVQKAQQEIDATCDADSMPRASDWERLPYINAIIKETLRFRPPFPWGVLHELTEDDHWNGYNLPKGSSIMLNIWNIHMNPTRYDRPHEFRPERFLTYPLSATQYIKSNDRDVFTFGAGRRSCPGIALAELSMFLALSKILWAFDLSTPDGNPIDISLETGFEGSTMRQPLPFALECRVRRDAEGGCLRQEVIDREMESATEWFAGL